MTQKIVIIGLAIAIVAVIGFGLYDAAQVNDEEPQTNALPLLSTATPQNVSATPRVVDDESFIIEAAATQPVSELMVEIQNTMGEPWQAEGTITLLEDFGFTLQTDTGEYFVELGPPTYWQNQGLVLTMGAAVAVDGYYNGEQVHARVVTIDGAELLIRNETGQPMWSGRSENAGNAEGTPGTGQSEIQVSAEDWVTRVGTINTVNNGNVTMLVDDGSILNLQMGQPQFWQSQGVMLSVGDAVEVLGFWSGNQFMAGDIRKTETGETIMLRDPNGRQLWAGPGRNGNQGNGGNGNQGNGNQGNGNQGNGNQGNRRQANQATPSLDPLSTAIN